MVTGVHVTVAQVKNKIIRTPAGEVPPSDPESRERLEILPGPCIAFLL
jgi:hypothetical protein